MSLWSDYVPQIDAEGIKEREWFPMRAWQVATFGIDSLEFVERPTPAPGPGEVLVGVRAISLNYRDLMVVKGQYNPRMKLPRIPCSDCSGEVVAVGTGVGTWKPGDRVMAIFMQNWLEGPITAAKARGALGGDIDGVLTDYVVLKQEGLVAVPQHLSFQEAATLPCAAVTAWNALAAGDLKPGAAVLIQGTGGVSIFALQFARLKGARVLGISSSNEKLGRANAMGLDSGLNYRDNPEWDRWAMDQTDGEGVDLVVEVGGQGTLARSLRALRNDCPDWRAVFFRGPVSASPGSAQDGAHSRYLCRLATGLCGDEPRDIADRDAPRGRRVPLDPGARSAGAHGGRKSLWQDGADGELNDFC